MAPGRNFDDDAPPTKVEDWVGAAIVHRDDGKPRHTETEMTFFIFQSSTDSSLFVITDRNDTSGLPECPKDGRWSLFKSFKETGQPRIGFSEAEAKSDIEDRGFHWSRVRISTKESAA